MELLRAQFTLLTPHIARGHSPTALRDSKCHFIIPHKGQNGCDWGFAVLGDWS